MPSFVGNLKVVRLDGASILHVGDSLNLAPSNVSKTYAGSGSFNTGDLPTTFNAVSATSTADPDVIDSSQKDTSVV